MTGDGVDILVRRIFENLPHGPLLYPEDEFTNQPERIIAAELVREQILRSTSDEIPYVTAVLTEFWDETGETTRIGCVVYVERQSHRAILIGKGGARLKEIGTAARKEIEAMLGRQIFLNIFVKVREHWRDDERTLNELGITG